MSLFINIYICILQGLFTSCLIWLINLLFLLEFLENVDNDKSLNEFYESSVSGITILHGILLTFLIMQVLKFNVKII